MLLGASSGALLLCATPPQRLYPLVFVAFVPLLRAGGERRAIGAAAAGWTAGIVFYLDGFDWLPATIAHLQGVGRAAAAAIFGCFVAWHAFQFALAAALATLCRRTRACRAWLTRATTAAAAWALLEWAFPQVFPWSVGDALGADARLRQVAELGGVHGLALLVMLVNALLAEGSRRRSAARHRLRAAALAVAVLGCAFAYGAWRAPVLCARAGPRIAVVQGGLAVDARDPFATSERAFRTYARFTESVAPDAELVVWPETVLRVYVRDNPVYRARLAALADAVRRPLLLGALDRSGNGEGEFNSAYLFADNAAVHLPAVYHKAALLPFGEYVPGAAWWSALRRWEVTGDFVAGAAPAPLFVRLRGAQVRLAASICFEAIRPGAFNQLVRDGAGLLVNLSDDAWLASEKAAAQHLALTRLRAVETRRWLVRASNSGISAFIDPGGGIVAALPLGAVGTLVHQVETGSVITPYVRWGEWVVGLCVLLLLIGALQ